jgi:hypothetical protein
MSSWKFDPTTLTILNTEHGAWRLPLKEVADTQALAHWLLQAAKHDFNIWELMEEFRAAIQHCFGSKEVNGATMLQFLFQTAPENRGCIVDWTTGTVDVQ